MRVWTYTGARAGRAIRGPRLSMMSTPSVRIGEELTPAEVEIKLIEDPEPLGPFGAKGVGEPALIATPAAILGAIRHATGVRITRVPALPHRLRAALAADGGRSSVRRPGFY